MFVSSIYIPDHLRPNNINHWPFSVPAIRSLLESPLFFQEPITVLIGENGSGKSTLIEAIAEGFKMDARGGRASRKVGNPTLNKTSLGEVTRLRTTTLGSRMLAGSRLKRKGFFLRAETAFNMAQNLGGVPGYWEADTAKMSHGEGYMEMLYAMCRWPGLYVFDEPESGLSFESSLKFLFLLEEIRKIGGQVIMATHSPVLASIPNADIMELSSSGINQKSWEDLSLVQNWKRFLERPSCYAEFEDE